MKNKYCPEEYHQEINLLAPVGCPMCDALNRQREDMEKEIEKAYHKGYYEGISTKKFKLPKKISMKHALSIGSHAAAGYTIGWNACLDEIQSLSASQAEGSREEEDKV